VESPAKLPASIRCPECGATYRRGRWTWGRASEGQHEQRCPACEAVAADTPSGILHVGGAFAVAHRAELIALIHHVEERERAEHPLKRVLSISDEAGGFSVKTTDGKLAESMGRALAKAYAGEVLLPRTTAEQKDLVRVRWVRD
jgi:hypothetical protein